MSQRNARTTFEWLRKCVRFSTFSLLAQNALHPTRKAGKESPNEQGKGENSNVYSITNMDTHTASTSRSCSVFHEVLRRIDTCRKCLFSKCRTRPIKRKLSDPKVQIPASLSSSLDTTDESNTMISSTALPSPSSSSNVFSTVVSVCTFISLDIIFQLIMNFVGWTFPHSLVGCVTLFSIFSFATLTTVSTDLDNNINKDLANIRISENLNVLSSPSTKATTTTTNTTTDIIIQRFFQPGADIFAKWLPVLFCPILITLPVTDTGIQSITELVKLAVVIIGGFFINLIFIAISIIIVRRLIHRRKTEEQQQHHSQQHRHRSNIPYDITLPIPSLIEKEKLSPVHVTAKRKIGTGEKSDPVKKERPFSNMLMSRFRRIVLLSGFMAIGWNNILSISLSLPLVSSKSLNDDAMPERKAAEGEVATISQEAIVEDEKEETNIMVIRTVTNFFQTTFLLLVTLQGFAIGSRMTKQIQKIFHPILICTITTWIAIWMYAIVIDSTFCDVLQSYQRVEESYTTTTTSPRTITATATGAGDILIYLLGPMIISLSVPMYNRRTLMWNHAWEVGTAAVISSMGSLFGTAFAVRYMNINPLYRRSVIPRAVTPSLAMAIAQMLHTDRSVTVVVVVLTGLVGASFGTRILQHVLPTENGNGILNNDGTKHGRINVDPIIRGLSLGASAHGLGAASLCCHSHDDDNHNQDIHDDNDDDSENKNRPGAGATKSTTDEDDAFSFAALAMTLTGLCSTMIVSVPAIQQLLLKT